MSALRTLAHPRVWQLAAVLFGFDIGVYGTTFYLPQARKAILVGKSKRWSACWCSSHISPGFFR